MAALSIVHVPFCYFPDTVGGTEVYVHDLAREQITRGHRVLVLAPAAAAARYTHDGVHVARYEVSDEINDVRDLYSSDKTDAAAFLAAVREAAADIVHIHGVGRAVAPSALAQLREDGVRVVLTYHTPTTTCMRGTLLEHGAHPCDGALDANRCTACTLTSHGVPGPLANVLARAPAAASALLRTTHARGRLVTALRMRELVSVRHDQTRRILDLADHIVAPAEWVQRLLLKLAVPSEKITLSRQGIRAARQRATRAPSSLLRLVYVGRVEPGKGVRILAEALHQIPTAQLELHIYGVVQNQSHQRYRAELQRDIARDPRMVLRETVPPDEMVHTIAQYDVLLAPSQQLETGPLVVLEAFAAGIPVIGSRLGGIAELVQHDVNGLLIDSAAPAEWAAAIERLLHEPGVLERLAAAVPAPRSITAVADDMDVVYQRAGG